jgi:hypothetical protein
MQVIFTMKKQITFHEKSVAIKLSQAAAEQSQKLNNVLLIEIQIYFSCMLGKRLAFYTDSDINGTWQVEKKLFASMIDDSEQLSDNIYVRFNTVMTKACPVSDYIGPPPVTDFTIRNQKPYVPNWLAIDFKEGLWSGEYGWKASQSSYKNTKQIRAKALRANSQ